MQRYLSSILLVCGSLLCSQAHPASPKRDIAPSMPPPWIQTKTHTIGNMRLGVSNWGSLGGNNLASEYWSCEFPKYSKADYLFYGGIWIGAIADGETLVSVGVDGYLLEHELFPGSSPEDTMIERSCDTLSPHYDPNAVSKQDLIAVYTDTVGPPYAPPDHRPMGVKVTQESYAWSRAQGDDFIFLNFLVENIGTRFLTDVHFGLYIDADCSPVTGDANCKYWDAQDDVVGFRRWRDESDTLWPPGTLLYQWSDGVYVEVPVGGTAKYQDPSEYIMTAWAADADGWSIQPYCPLIELGSAVGDRFLSPLCRRFSFNWWDSENDWGPHDKNDPSDPPGIPIGDGAKYRIMSNARIDPNQICDTLTYPPGMDSIFDTRYLIACGPFDLVPGETQWLRIVHVGGENFHSSAQLCDYDLTDLATNANRAHRFYDNPGVDTDANGNAGDFVFVGGDTLYITGDGVPDFKGPYPPPTPLLEVASGDQQVTLRWKQHSEVYANRFVPPPYDIDYFEGYRIYRSETDRVGEFTLLAEFDRIDFDTSGTKPLFWNRGMPESIEVHNGETTYVYVDGPMLNYYPRCYAVTAFDKGFPPGYGDVLPSLETSPLSNVTMVTASPVPENLGGQRGVQVVPNPYKISEDYASIRWEDWEGAGWSEHTRRLDFINLPRYCTIRIYTLNGDLVRTLEHDGDENESNGLAASAESWNLVTRDVEAIVSGLYLFSVEEHPGGRVQVGKFLILK